MRGPNVGPGYWRRPEATGESRTADGWFATDESRTADGWFVTGDVGRLDRQGRLTLEGRASDMIISGGLNVYPIEIEQVLDAHPAVVEAALVGLEHPDLGEAIVAFVVTGPDDAGDWDELASALAHTLEDLARFKHPKRYVFVDELPRNAMGKVLKAELRARHADLFLN